MTSQNSTGSDLPSSPDRRGALRSGHWVVLVLVVAGLLGLGTIAYFEHRTRPARETYWQVHADLRTLAEAGQQYLVEHGVEEVRVRDLVPEHVAYPTGAPWQVYEDLVIRERGQLRVVLPNQVEVFFNYP